MHKPITESESKELLLDSYVMYINNHHCAACGALERFSQCFEVWVHPTKTRTTGLRDLRPISGRLKDLPLAVLAANEKVVPICYKCSWTHQNRGKPTVAQPPLSREAWAETLKRKYAPTPNEPKIATRSAASPKMVPTLDQL